MRKSVAKTYVDGYVQVIMSALQDYTDEVSETVRDEVAATAKETRSDLKRTSPKLTGEYAKGWAYRVAIDSKGRYVIKVYNSIAPSLTHLLEYGHDSPATGHVSGKPHISPASEKAAQKLVNKVKISLR